MPKSTKYVAKVADERGHIDYTTEEDAVWADLYAAQQENVQRYMAREYLEGWRASICRKQPCRPVRTFRNAYWT